jgi:hypothetical protein
MKCFVQICLGFLLLAHSSCTKPLPEPRISSTEIFGDWEWTSDRGGITGRQVYTPASTGGKRVYRFQRDSSFVECVNNRCSTPTKFTLRRERSRLYGNEQLVLTLRRKYRLAPPDTGAVVSLDRYVVQDLSDSLRLVQEVHDGYVERYVRK